MNIDAKDIVIEQIRAYSDKFELLLHKIIPIILSSWNRKYKLPYDDDVYRTIRKYTSNIVIYDGKFKIKNMDKATRPVHVVLYKHYLESSQTYMAVVYYGDIDKGGDNYKCKKIAEGKLDDIL
ncbi:MAG: hypothetical protein HRT87_11825 [Legionellales bacterium]|nr:hypothetical protein [Legionellales bacterium]